MSLCWSSCTCAVSGSPSCLNATENVGSASERERISIACTEVAPCGKVTYPWTVRLRARMSRPKGSGEGSRVYSQSRQEDWRFSRTLIWHPSATSQTLGLRTQPKRPYFSGNICSSALWMDPLQLDFALEAVGSSCASSTRRAWGISTLEGRWIDRSMRTQYLNHDKPTGSLVSGLWRKPQISYVTVYVRVTKKRPIYYASTKISKLGNTVG